MADQGDMDKINEAVEAAVEKAMERVQTRFNTGGEDEAFQKQISEAMNKALDGRLPSISSQERQQPPAVTVQRSSHNSSSGKFLSSCCLPHMR